MSCEQDLSSSVFLLNNGTKYQYLVIPLTAIVVKMVLQTAANLPGGGGGVLAV